MKGFNHSCIGASHKTTGKPCQDSSVYYSDETSGIHIAIVCDGHGGDSYFRSDRGSRFLAEITRGTILEFVKGTPSEIFSTDCLVQAESNVHPDKYRVQDSALNHLFSSIIYRWQEAIERDALMEPLTPEELQDVKPELIKTFQEGKGIEKAYGSTLMAYFQTAEYWVAFHIGDGHCIMFTEDGHIFEPVPWDERCFLNNTTSICDHDALKGFRYAWQGGGGKPFAVFLGSDGIDDSFGDGRKLHDFYLSILRSIVKEGLDETKCAIIEELPDISDRGSRDDMSISFIYDEQLIVKTTLYFTMKQLDSMQEELETTKKDIVALESKKQELSRSYSKLKDKIDEQEKANAGISGRITKIRKLICKGEQECCNLERQRKDLETSKSSLDYKGERMRVELKYATNDLDRAREKESGIVSQIQYLDNYLDNTHDNNVIEDNNNGD